MSPKGCQNEAKIGNKSVKKSVENCAGFLIGVGSFFCGFWECFGDPGPSKMSVSCRRGAIFQKFTVFFTRFGLGQIFDRFFNVLRSILGAKMVSKWVENSMKKLMDFWIAPGRGLGRQKRS